MLKKNNFFSILNLLLLTVSIYIITNYYATKTYSFYIFIFFLIYSISVFIFKKQRTIKVYSLTITVLLLVGVTGWFLSPFLSYLYILAIALAFLFSPLTSSLFVVTLVGIFLFRTESKDMVIDTLTLLSLFSIIPLSRFLRNEYLNLRENEKKILILQEDNKKYKNVLDDILANKIVKFAVTLKEPLNDIKQIAHFAKSEKVSNHNSHEAKIIALSENALKTLEDFEKHTTGLKLLETPTIGN